MEPQATHQAIEAVWRIESARLLGGLVRMVRDLDMAEDMAQEALVEALERWPAQGIPDNPGAWLMAVAKNRALDEFRRKKMANGKHEAIAAEPPASRPEPIDFEALDHGIEDDTLRLILVSCHPVLAPEARAALTLRLIGGLTTDEIARAFLQSEPTIAQRIVRAKRSLAEAKVPFEVPRGAELSARIPSVLEVIYLIYNEGYAATQGSEWMRRELCEDALRLGRILAGLLPGEPEVLGLLSLMEIQSSRLGARRGPDGEPILLLDQDRGRWDQLLIRRGLEALKRAEGLKQPLGPYTLQASIAACHARAAKAADTDWKRIVALYDALAQLTQSPVVELNRAVAVSMAFGPKEGLDLVDALVDEPALQGYHLLPSVRGDLLSKLGRLHEARIEFERAATLTQNAREREFLLARAAHA